MLDKSGLEQERAPPLPALGGGLGQERAPPLPAPGGGTITHPVMDTLSTGLALCAMPPRVGGSDNLERMSETELHTIVITELNSANSEVLGVSVEDPEEREWYKLNDLFLVNPWTQQTPTVPNEVLHHILHAKSDQTHAKPASGEVARGPQEMAIGINGGDPNGEEDDSQMLTTDETEAAQYTKKAAAFLRHVEDEAKGAKISMAKLLSDAFPSGHALKTAIVDRVPWKVEVGYITFQRQPTGNAKGHMHITQLAFMEDAYPGQGVYLSDAILILEQRGLQDIMNGLTVRPISAGRDLSLFGWMPDGSIVNGTRAFALSVLALFSIVGHWQPELQRWPKEFKWQGPVPAKVLDVLQKVKCKYVRHDNLQSRVLANLIETAVNSKTNRSIEDPLFLSREMMRNNLKDHNVKTVMNLYKQRAMANQSLKLKDSVQDAAMRFMQPGKVSEESRSLLSAHIAEKSWQNCAFTAHTLMAARFPVNAPLANWYDELLVQQGLQTSRGQALAIEIGLKVADPQLTQMDFDTLCGACGMWVVVKEHVLPQLAFGSKDIEELDKDFKESTTYRSQIVALTCKEPNERVANFMDLAKWVLEHIAFLRLAKEAKAAQAVKPGAVHPNTVLNEVEKVELNAGVYVGQLTLDVNMYRDASKRFSADSKAVEVQQETEKETHISDVRSAQDYFQLSDVRVEPVVDGGRRNTWAGAWVEHAAAACKKNYIKVCKLVGVADGSEDIAVLNIVALNSLGTLKMQVLERFRKEYSHFPGVTLVMFPLVPRDSHLTWGERGSTAAVGADDLLATDSDVEDPEAADHLSHDFSSDTLPEAITKAVAKMSSKQRIVQLTKDQDSVKRVLVHDNVTQSHYAKGIHCAHVEDGVGARETTEGVLLIPVADDVMTGFENTTAVRSGMFTNVPTSTSYVSVNKKVAMQAKRAGYEHWKFQCPSISSPKYCQSKVARGQLGDAFYSHVICDFVKNCSRKVVLINDLVMGCGEVGVAAVGAKHSDEATNNCVRVCYFGFEYRRNYHEVANARVRTCVGEAYLNGKLNIAGRRPVPAHVERSKMARAQIASLLPRPMAQLSINADGDLILPDRANIPVQITQSISSLLDELEEEFPQPVVVVRTPTPAPTPAPGEPAAAVGAGAAESGALLPAGTVINDRATLAGMGWSIVKESPSGVAEHFVVLAEHGATRQVFLENAKAGNSKIDCGAFVGKGGPGEFVNETPEVLAAEKAKYAWHYTRLTDYKKDTAKYANGCVILAGEQEEIPRLRTLAQCEEVLGQSAFGGNAKVLKVYGHASTAGARTNKIVPQTPGVLWVPAQQEPADGSSFVALNMGQWIQSQESKLENKPQYECAGVLRPAFEVSLDDSKTMKPNNSVDANALGLFTCKTLHMKPKSLIAL